MGKRQWIEEHCTDFATGYGYPDYMAPYVLGPLGAVIAQLRVISEFLHGKGRWPALSRADWEQLTPGQQATGFAWAKQIKLPIEERIKACPDYLRAYFMTKLC